MPPKAKAQKEPEVGKVKSLQTPQQLQDERNKRILQTMVIGYGFIDFLGRDANIEFGRWNTRGIDPLEVAKLRKSFETHGMRIDETPMPVVVKRSAIVEGTTSIDDPSLMSPTIKWTGNERPRVIAAGGQHRTAAMRAIAEEAQTMLKKHLHNKAIVAIRERKVAAQEKLASPDSGTVDERQEWSDDVDEAEAEIAKLRREVAVVEEQATYGKWLAIVYDEGEHASSILR